MAVSFTEQRAASVTQKKLELGSSRRWRVYAGVAWPACAIVLLTYSIFGDVYESADRRGVVVFGRHRWWKELVGGLMTVLLPLLILGFLLFCVSADLVLWIIIPLVTLFAIAIGVGLVLMVNGGTHPFPVTRKTPKGRRLLIGALAQHPDHRKSRSGALSRARSLASNQPRDSVLVAVAANDEMLNHYENWGFKQGKGMRVHKEVPRNSGG